MNPVAEIFVEPAGLEETPVPQSTTPLGTAATLSPAMRFELFIEAAPITVNNFIRLAEEGFYNGLTFHRVVKDYVIQGGSANNTCDCPADFTIKGEFAANGINTGLTHERGALSMARDPDYDSAGTQFFVVHRDAHKLDGKYAAFGKMLEGFEVLDAIASVPTAGSDAENRPLKPVFIKTIVIRR